MSHSLLKFKLKTGVLCLVATAFLVGCGVKPTLNELAVPKSDKDVALDAPVAAETIDGKIDEQAPVSKRKEKSGFLLDFLL
ncbi:MAG: hypothetical protein ABJK39_06925 [Hyphomicrobiales bacterium]